MVQGVNARYHLPRSVLQANLTHASPARKMLPTLKIWALFSLSLCFLSQPGHLKKVFRCPSACSCSRESIICVGSSYVPRITPNDISSLWVASIYYLLRNPCVIQEYEVSFQLSLAVFYNVHHLSWCCKATPSWSLSTFSDWSLFSFVLAWWLSVYRFCFFLPGASSMGLSPRSKRQCLLTCHLSSYCKSTSTACPSSDAILRFALFL